MYDLGPMLSHIYPAPAEHLLRLVMLALVLVEKAQVVDGVEAATVDSWLPTSGRSRQCDGLFFHGSCQADSTPSIGVLGESSGFQ